MFSSSSSLSAPPPLVVDWGSYSLRIGTAGDALPRCLLPAVVGLPHPQLCCSSSSSGSRFKWRGGLSSNCRLLAGAGSAAGAAAAGSLGYGGAAAAAFICPLNPLQKRDHVDVYPVVVYEHPGFALAAAGAARLKQQHSDTDWMAAAAEEDGSSSSSRTRNTREQRIEYTTFSAAAGSSCTLPGAYHVDMNGFESLIEAACSADALDEGTLEGRAVLLSEPNAMDKPLRDAYAELMFESFKTSQLFLGKKAALACFGCARTSSLVVDVGHSHASACGVQEGYVLQKSIREIPFAAQQLSILSRLSLSRSGAALTPGYAVTRVPFAAAAADGVSLEGAGGSAAAGEELWGGGSSSGGTSEGGAALLAHACKKSHLHSSKGSSSSSGCVVAAAAAARHAAGAAGRGGTAAGGVKSELLRGGTGGATGVCCSTDRRYRETVEVAACPHVTQSYREWACFHLAEVLAQVLGECHPTAAAARKQRQELLLCQQQQGQWTATAAASAGATLLLQQQRGGGGGGRRRGTSAAGGGQALKSAAAGTGRSKTEEDMNAGEQQLLQQADNKQQSAGGRRSGGGGGRRRSSGTSGGGGAAPAGDRKRGSGSSDAAAAARGQRSSGRGKGIEGADDEEEEPPYLLPDGTPVAADTVKVVREGVAEALFSVPLRLQVFSEVWAASSSRTTLAAAAAFPAAFVDAWRCCSAAAGSAVSSTTGRSHTSSADAAAAAAAGSSSGSAPLWNVYEAAATGATYPRFLSRVALSGLIKDTLSSCGRGAARRDVTATIIPTGGGSLYPGFLPRFKAELRALAEDATVGSLLSQHSSAGAAAGGWGSSSSEAAAALLSVSQPLRVVASPVDVERHFASWIGGSILSCLGSFTQFAVTKEEYDEYGARVAIGRKCP